VVNFFLVDDPTFQQPGFDLSQQQWSLLNGGLSQLHSADDEAVT